MTKKETSEGNKLIAEFMNIDINDKDWDDKRSIYRFYEKHTPMFNDEYYDGSLIFNESWDWLMPVLEKIEKLGVSTNIHYFAGIKKYGTSMENNKIVKKRNTTSLLGYSISEYDSTSHKNSKIESIYEAVIKFIKWYNKNKET